jgi:aspartate aminotransferase
MTGWRIGWALGPKAAISAMSAMQSHLTSNPTSFCQTATVEGFKSAQECVGRMKAAFEKRRDLMLSALAALTLARTPVPGGAFYVFPDVAAYIERLGLEGSVPFSEWLLEHARVVVVPGEPFGNDRCIRLSFATSEAAIEEGISRLVSALGEGA